MRLNGLPTVGQVYISRWFTGTLLILCLTGFVWHGARAQSSADKSYLLNPGDVLEVSVWKEKDLSRKVLVRPDGMISFPLAGHLKAAGRSTEQIEAALTQRLGRYLKDPVVTVSVAQTPGNKIFVIGQVRKPGAYSSPQPITVMQALSLAGGLTPFGDENDIIIIRTVKGKQTRIRFDYSKAKRGKDLSQNITLKSGDVVVVPD